MSDLRGRHAVLAGLFVLCLPITPAPAESTLIKFGKDTEWRYQDDGRSPGEEWCGSSFDDSNWESGTAPLGYGDPGLNTTVSFGADEQKKHITVYFRHTFQVADVEELGKLVLLIRSDDGIIVYLNGNEIIRNNLPPGDVGLTTLATTRFDGLSERLYRFFVVPATRLVSGTNVVAVEVHQANAQSSDVFLDLVLRAYHVDENVRPTLVPKARKATVEYLTKHYVGPTTTIINGYLDGGRGMRIGGDGIARSGREVIVVNRARDASLRKHLEFAKSEEMKALDPLKRATRLATYVDRTMSIGKNGRLTEAAVSLMAKEYANEGVLIGEVSRICGAGVCRHRSLLFKVLADEAGLNVALVRGNYSSGRATVGHAWNELHLGDGKRVLIDAMQRHVELLVPGGSTTSRRYLTVRNKPWYTKAEESEP